MGNIYPFGEGKWWSEIFFPSFFSFFEERRTNVYDRYSERGIERWGNLSVWQGDEAQGLSVTSSVGCAD